MEFVCLSHAGGLKFHDVISIKLYLFSVVTYSSLFGGIIVSLQLQGEFLIPALIISIESEAKNDFSSERTEIILLEMTLMAKFVKVFIPTNGTELTSNRSQLELVRTLKKDN